MSNISIIGKEARAKVIKGFSYMALAVRSTMGPFGANTLTEKGNTISNDGLRTAKEVAPTIVDEFERRGAIVGLEGAKKAEEETGDGTTATITLTDEILKIVSKLLSTDTIASKKNPSDIIKQLRSEKDDVIEQLKSKAEMIESEEALIKSALVSTEDETLAKLIGEAQWKLGKDGILIAEETADRNCSVEFVNGIRFDNGFGTSVAINDQEKQALVVKDSLVIMTNYTFNDTVGLSPLDEIFKQIYDMGKRQVIVIARAFSETAIRRAMNETQTGFSIYPINAPYTDQAEIMKDISTVLGGTYINTEERSLESIQLSDLGFTTKLIAKRYSAIITGNNDELSKTRIDKRLEELKDKKKGEVSMYEKKNIDSRIAQLGTGFAIVKVGANTESDRKYLKDKADDAVVAVRCALQEGVVTGAGLAFKDIAEKMSDTSLLKRPLQSIYEQIMNRAPSDFVVESWVKDPVKVLRCALHYAVETAGRLATVENIVVTENPPKCKCNNKGSEE